MAKSPRPPLDLALPRQRIVGEDELGLAQPLDLVAEPRRLLELEVAGGFEHALLQVGHVRLEIVADHAFLGEAGVDAHVVALVDASRGCRGSSA